MNKFLDWLDDRSGIRGLVKEALYEKVPGGARWRYVWGSCLTFAFLLRLLPARFYGCHIARVHRLLGKVFTLSSIRFGEAGS